MNLKMSFFIDEDEQEQDLCTTSGIELNSKAFCKGKSIKVAYSILIFFGTALILTSIPNFLFPSVYSQNTTIANSDIDITNSSTSFLTYEDPEGKYTISYPSDWSPEKSELVSPGLFYPNKYYNATVADQLDFPSFQITSGLDLSRTFDDVVGYYKNLHANDNLTESEAFELHGNPAYKLVYESTAGSKTMEIRTRTQTPDDFTFIYSVAPEFYEKYLPTIQAMIDSFRETQSNTSS